MYDNSFEKLSVKIEKKLEGFISHSSFILIITSLIPNNSAFTRSITSSSDWKEPSWIL